MNNSQFRSSTATNAEGVPDGSVPLTAEDHRSMLLALLGLTADATDGQVRLAHKGAMASIEAAADQKGTAKNTADLSTPLSRRMAFEAFLDPLTRSQEKGGRELSFNAAMALMRSDTRGRAILAAMDNA
jgi:hypothetical protein